MQSMQCATLGHKNLAWRRFPRGVVFSILPNWLQTCN